MILKKRIAGFLLASAMLMSMVPAAFAADNGQVNAVLKVNSSAYTDRLDSSDDENRYEFTTDKAGYISLDFGKEYDSRTARGWQVTVCTSSGENIITRNFYCGNTETESTCKIGLPAGTYYIRVGVFNDAEYWTDVEYHIKVTFTASDVWESESNDTIGQADPVSNDSTYYGTLRESDDMDYYKFEAPARGYMSLAFGRESCGASKAWNILVLDSNGNQVMSQGFYGESKQEESTGKVSLSKGTYYIGISAYDSMFTWTDAEYRFNIVFTASDAWETEPNNEPANANSILNNETYYGTLNNAEDTDYFQLTLDTAASVYLNFGSEMGGSPSGGWNISLYNSKMELEQANRHQYAAAKIETFPSITLSKGTHYIKVTANNSWSPAAYNLKVTREFTDVPADSYYAKAVDWGVQNQITSGATFTTFGPDAACTRGQIVTMLWRAMGSPKPSSKKNPFKDIKPDAYFYDAVLWAVEKGITSGTTPSSFSPDTACTRAQAMTFLWISMGSSSTLNTISFKDVKSSDYYYKPVRWAVKMGITKGTSDTAFSPNNQCTRAQIITFLYKAMA